MGGSAIDDKLPIPPAAAEVRPQGAAVVTTRVHGDANVTIEVVAADTPLLVESVLTAVEDFGLQVAGIEHPIVPVRRDAAGRLVAYGDDARGAEDESWISVRAFATAALEAETLRAAVARAVDLLGALARDTEAIHAQLTEVGTEFVAPDGVRAEYRDLIDWIGSGANFHVVGYARGDGGPGLGVWSDPGTARVPALDGLPSEPVIDRGYLETGVLRTRYPMILRFSDGAVEHQFLGTFSSIGIYQSVRQIPVVRGKVAAVLRAHGFDEDSFNGLAAVELLQTYPLFALFSGSVEEISHRLDQLLVATVDRSVRLFARRCHDGRTLSALAYLPRDRYSSDVRAAIIEGIEGEVGGSKPEFATRLADGPLAQLQVMMRVPAQAEPGDLRIGSPAHARLERLLTAAAASWEDGVRALIGPDAAVGELLPALSTRYREERPPAAAAVDLPIVAGLAAEDVHVDLRTGGDTPWTFVLYLAGRDAALTELLPMLGSLGLTVLDEHPYLVDRADGVGVRIYEFTVAPAPHVSVADPESSAPLLAEAFRRMWLGHIDVDELNELVLRAGLSCAAISVLRTYVRYLQQCGLGNSVAHFAEVLGEYRASARGLVDLFVAWFDPAIEAAARPERVAVAERALDAELAAILSLDADRAIGAIAATIRATLRTNYFRADDAQCRRADEGFAPTVAIKLATARLALAPPPRPAFEIFVHSPRVEGVHLRFGAVARGGCRWSERREDFRTEVLGLVKAQAVKNAVIVPAGAKGGFVVRRAPVLTGDAAADRAALRAEGIACYRAFVAALIQLTDNRVHGRILPPRAVVRRDDDDPYLVMAADKGTASFSDIANAVAADYDFWLGDAFASGGSVGYDHKAMGITARGAWEAVKRHFRELDVDVQSQPFTAVGIGDMSGDVFGNGMLASRFTRLVAAFDHRHIFLDPDPEPVSSYAERERLFALPRSSWADYRTELISAGGGVFPREVKSVPISPHVRRALGLAETVTALSPPELIQAILRAPVDLLFNGGIGTYLRADDESDASVGDKANDAVRVSTDQLRVRVVGEGGNLGVTERGRVQADLCGVRINTDALDNSAGVDCSDHEVNIKILLDAQIASGALDPAERTALLESMTDDVAELVLADNITQNAELGCARRRGDEEADLYARLLADLSERGVDLALETLPTPAELMARREATGRGLTSPELATVMAHVKLEAKAELVGTTLLDGEVFAPLVESYFPPPLRERFAAGIAEHSLRRELAATMLVNRMVDDGGITHLFRITEATTATVAEAARASTATDEVFGVSAQIARLRAGDLDAAVLDAMTQRARMLLSRACRWFLEHRPQPLAIAAEVRRYRGAAALTELIDQWARPTIAADLQQVADAYIADGADPELARAVARAPYRLHLLDIADLAEITDRTPEEVGDLAFAVLEHFAIDELLVAVGAQERIDRWHLMARLALRDDLHALVRSLTSAILSMSEPGESAETKIADWEAARSATLARVLATVEEVKDAPEPGIAGLTVAVRALRSVV
ncbi:NAD-glutamate dehydrogenase domain-containing protein [Gordonia phosphorivorans]|uniref:NAD-glutamate dehydrogenase domain-containing protein n=1 Tax=Gordonia phosphorivorans TaxID=1056982 RepID=A0ABV6H876_9ACTN